MGLGISDYRAIARNGSADDRVFVVNKGENGPEKLQRVKASGVKGFLDGRNIEVGAIKDEMLVYSFYQDLRNELVKQSGDIGGEFGELQQVAMDAVREKLGIGKKANGEITIAEKALNVRTIRNMLDFVDAVGKIASEKPGNALSVKDQNALSLFKTADFSACKTNMHDLLALRAAVLRVSSGQTLIEQVAVDGRKVAITSLNGKLHAVFDSGACELPLNPGFSDGILMKVFQNPKQIKKDILLGELDRFCAKAAGLPVLSEEAQLGRLQCKTLLQSLFPKGLNERMLDQLTPQSLASVARAAVEGSLPPAKNVMESVERTIGKVNALTGEPINPGEPNALGRPVDRNINSQENDYLVGKFLKMDKKVQDQVKFDDKVQKPPEKVSETMSEAEAKEILNRHGFVSGALTALNLFNKVTNLFGYGSEQPVEQARGDVPKLGTNDDLLMCRKLFGDVKEPMKAKSQLTFFDKFKNVPSVEITEAKVGDILKDENKLRFVVRLLCACEGQEDNFDETLKALGNFAGHARALLDASTDLTEFSKIESKMRPGNEAEVMALFKEARECSFAKAGGGRFSLVEANAGFEPGMRSGDIGWKIGLMLHRLDQNGLLQKGNVGLDDFVGFVRSDSRNFAAIVDLLNNEGGLSDLGLLGPQAKKAVETLKSLVGGRELAALEPLARSGRTDDFLKMLSGVRTCEFKNPEGAAFTLLDANDDFNADMKKGAIGLNIGRMIHQLNGLQQKDGVTPEAFVKFLTGDVLNYSAVADLLVHRDDLSGLGRLAPLAKEAVKTLESVLGKLNVDAEVLRSGDVGAIMDALRTVASYKTEKDDARIASMRSAVADLLQDSNTYQTDKLKEGTGECLLFSLRKNADVFVQMLCNPEMIKGLDDLTAEIAQPVLSTMMDKLFGSVRSVFVPGNEAEAGRVFSAVLAQKPTLSVLKKAENMISEKLVIRAREMQAITSSLFAKMLSGVSPEEGFVKDISRDFSWLCGVLSGKGEDGDFTAADCDAALDFIGRLQPGMTVVDLRKLYEVAGYGSPASPVSPQMELESLAGYLSSLGECKGKVDFRHVEPARDLVSALLKSPGLNEDSLGTAVTLNNVREWVLEQVPEDMTFWQFKTLCEILCTGKGKPTLENIQDRMAEVSGLVAGWKGKDQEYGVSLDALAKLHVVLPNGVTLDGVLSQMPKDADRAAFIEKLTGVFVNATVLGGITTGERAIEIVTQLQAGGHGVDELVSLKTSEDGRNLTVDQALVQLNQLPAYRSAQDIATVVDGLNAEGIEIGRDTAVQALQVLAGDPQSIVRDLAAALKVFLEEEKKQ